MTAFHVMLALFSDRLGPQISPEITQTVLKKLAFPLVRLRLAFPRRPALRTFGRPWES